MQPLVCTRITRASPSHWLQTAYDPSPTETACGAAWGGAEMSDDALVETVLAELSGWFGSDQTATWRSLEVQRIPYCQPPQQPSTDLLRCARALA